MTTNPMSSHRPNLNIHETSMHKGHAWGPHPAQEDFKVPLNLHIPADIRMGSNLKSLETARVTVLGQDLTRPGCKVRPMERAGKAANSQLSWEGALVTM